MGDAADFFYWRNEAHSRAMSFTSEPVAWSEHVRWFRRKLDDASTELHVVELDGLPVGQVRIDHLAAEAVLSFAIDPLVRGRGLGERAVAVAVERARHGRNVPVRADVKQGEVAQRVFQALCTAEQGQVGMKAVTTPKGESIERPSCTQANGSEPFELSRTEFVGPSVGAELAEDGAKALAFVVIGIMIYLALRFEWKFSVAAIVANLHDVVIILGFFAFFQWEFSLAVLAGTLAVLGYSVNESVVIFDRIRETFRRQRKMTPIQVIDHAITSTISRTIITHGSTQVMVLSMLLFGGPTLFSFALALTIGICFGIYSSVLVASPLLMWLGAKREQFIKPARKERGRDEHEGAVV